MLKITYPRHFVLWLIALAILFTPSVSIIMMRSPAVQPSTKSIAKQIAQPSTASITQQITQLRQQDPNLDKQALTHALAAYYHARANGLDKREILTLVDYQKPSTQKRLWVIDMHREKVLVNALVAHAKNSGNNFATHFSNQKRGRQSSLGLYLTKQVYRGKHGLSLRVQGLNPKLNGNAYQRAVVIHPANYVSAQFAKQHGRLGRSWGCFALSPKMAKKVIQIIKSGTLLYAYHPTINA